MASYDIAIVGGGPAGLSAAATAASAGLATLFLDPMGGGGELMNLGSLHDHTPPESGPDLAARLLDDAIAAGAELAIAEVAALTQTEAGWHIATTEDAHTARTVILATGLAPGILGLATEHAFEGQGLSHCAACDGPLYPGQPVVVAGADRWAWQEAADLAATASAVTLVTQGAQARTLDNVAVVEGRIVALHGANGLESVIVQPADGGAPRTIPAKALFVQTGRRPALTFAPDALARDADGHPIVDAAQKTNLPGLFAAGDARAGAERTLAAAIADGRRAAESAKAALNGPG